MVSELQDNEESHDDSTITIPELLDDEEVCTNETELSKWGVMFMIGGCTLIILFVFVG